MLISMIIQLQKYCYDNYSVTTNTQNVTIIIKVTDRYSITIFANFDKKRKNDLLWWFSHTTALCIKLVYQLVARHIPISCLYITSFTPKDSTWFNKFAIDITNGAQLVQDIIQDTTKWFGHHCHLPAPRLLEVGYHPTTINSFTRRSPLILCN